MLTISSILFNEMYIQVISCWLSVYLKVKVHCLLISLDYKRPLSIGKHQCQIVKRYLGRRYVLASSIRRGSSVRRGYMVSTTIGFRCEDFDKWNILGSSVLTILGFLFSDIYIYVVINAPIYILLLIIHIHLESHLFVSSYIIHVDFLPVQLK